MVDTPDFRALIFDLFTLWCSTCKTVQVVLGLIYQCWTLWLRQNCLFLEMRETLSPPLSLHVFARGPDLTSKGIALGATVLTWNSSPLWDCTWLVVPAGLGNSNPGGPLGVVVGGEGPQPVKRQLSTCPTAHWSPSRAPEGYLAGSVLWSHVLECKYRQHLVGYGEGPQPSRSS